jgi:ATP-dependent protease ClpP protease subunit
MRHWMSRGRELSAAARRAADRQERPWYRIRNADDDGDVAEVWIYDEIGMWGTTADDFARELAQVSASAINLHLNSPGGGVFDGIAIHNSLHAHPARVDVTVDGIAASIASVIAMAGDTVTMGRGTEMMIHNPSGIVLGQAADMREMADLLDRLALDIAGFYRDRAGGSRNKWLDLMAAETWYSADEAVKAGLADKAIGSGKTKAKPPADDPPDEDDDGEPAAARDRRWDLSAYRYAGRERAPSPAAAALSIRSASIRARHKARLEVCGK